VHIKAVDLVAAAQCQCFSRKELVVGVVLMVDGQNVAPAFVMAMVERLAGDGDKFTFRGGGTGTFGKPVDLSWPEQTLFSLPEADNVLHDILITLYRNPLLIGLHGVNALIIVLFSPGGGCRLFYEGVELRQLNLFRMVPEVFDLL
jgi:hypothetical protein